MKYYLTEKQWDNLPFWNIIEVKNSNSNKARVRLFQKYVQTKFNLKYDEILANDNDDYEELPPGWWGIVDGDEKYITWFLLTL
jgi:hypothetical protein